MPHVGQILPLAVRPAAAVLMFALIAAGCARSGDVVVVIDSTMRDGTVEVVALPLEPSSNASGGARRPTSALDSNARLISLRDSAATLDERFRKLRDTLRGEVRSLDSADRTTRAYAVRYADIRRRTLGAEALRSARDSVRAREEKLRLALGARADSSARSASATGRSPSSGDGRHPVRSSASSGRVTLSLAPGDWAIGLAKPGSDPTTHDAVTVRRGTTQTLHVGSSGDRRRP